LFFTYFVFFISTQFNAHIPFNSTLIKMSSPAPAPTPTPTHRYCRGCKLEQLLALFEGNRRQYKTCFVCRNRQTPVLAPPQQLLRLSDITSEFLELNERGDDGVCLDVDVLLDDNLRSLTDEQVKEFILDNVKLLDGYEYFWKHTGNPELQFGVTFEAVCSQDTKGKLCKKGLKVTDSLQHYIVCQHVDESRLQRRYQRTEPFDCQGKVTGFINRRHNWIHITVTHLLDHPTPANMELRMLRASPMPQSIKDFIESEVNIDDLNAVGLYEKVVANFGYVVTRSQVLNAWHKGFRNLYKKHEDQLVSSRLLVRSLREETGCEEVQYDGDYYLIIDIYGLAWGMGDVLGYDALD
jgi:hypothetical protein